MKSQHKDRRVLVVVDMQKDFVNPEVLGNSNTEMVEKKIIKKLTEHYDKYDAFYFTRDIHYENYLNTLEGKKLPVKHCIYGTEGSKFTDGIAEAIKTLRENGKYVKIITKHTFGSKSLTDILSCTCGGGDVIEICGVSTDICVVSNALSFRQEMPNRRIVVDSTCCAGTSVKAHNAALRVMNSCQIETLHRHYGKKPDSDNGEEIAIDNAKTKENTKEDTKEE